MSSKAWAEANRDLQAGYKKKHYDANKKRLIEEASNRRESRGRWFREYLADKKCGRCGESHPSCLDFHHRDPSMKVVNVSQSVNRCWSIEKILKEVAKCDILCANCHRKLHYKERDCGI